MVSVTLSRGTTSIDIQLVEEGGEQLLSSTFGKPEVNVRESGGSLNPRVQDQWSGVENYQLVGRVFDYQTAHDLVDLIKSTNSRLDTSGVIDTAVYQELTLEIPLSEYPDTISVAPGAGQEGALSLSFPSGKKNSVDVDLSLTRIDASNSGAAVVQEAQTPTASGSGPVQLSVGGTTVDLPTADLSLERTVGRPNDVVRREPRVADPRHEVKGKVTNDVFSLSFQTVENIPSTLNTLTDNIFRSRLGRTGLTLKFNGVLGLGDVQCIPVGSGPFRQVHQSGKGWVLNPVLELRRIFDTT